MSSGRQTSRWRLREPGQGQVFQDQHPGPHEDGVRGHGAAVGSAEGPSMPTREAPASTAARAASGERAAKSVRMAPRRRSARARSGRAQQQRLAGAQAAAGHGPGAHQRPGPGVRTTAGG
jgi:hypothetical protein